MTYSNLKFALHSEEIDTTKTTSTEKHFSHSVSELNTFCSMERPMRKPLDKPDLKRQAISSKVLEL